MATVQNMIDRALRIVGHLQGGSSPTATETADVLYALNGMLESWRNDRLWAYSMTTASLTLVAGTQTYTVGSSGDLNVTRPTKIETATMREGDIDYPVKVINEDQWNGLAYKADAGNIIELLYYNPTFPLGTLNVYPTPTAANRLDLTLWTPITDFSAASDTLSLPPGYRRAIELNLAVEIADEFGDGITNATLRQAADALAAVKRRNAPSMVTSTELQGMFPAGRVNIQTDNV